jgi:signal transduction histidine kinase
MASFSLLRHSLRFRLPLLISALVAIVLAVFLWAVEQTLNDTLVHSASSRAQTAADQFGSLMSQGAVRLIADARRAARVQEVRALLLDPTRDPAAARRILSPLTSANQPPVELWDSATRVLEVAPERPGVGPRLTTPPGREGIGVFNAVDGRVVYQVIADVFDAPSDTPTGSGGPRLGAIVVQRSLTNAQASDTINRLMGGNAAVGMGNAGGDVWTDLSKIVPAPLVATSQRGIGAYRGADGSDRIGALALIAETPWAIWVESPRSVVLEPARAVLRRLAALAMLFIAIAAVAVAIISGRITTPLREITRASEAMAGGEFSRRVHTNRRDEVGRLGAAFNAMAAHVSEAQRTLEARVQERTAGLQEVNQELEAFSYSVSHDLRAPLRHVIGFATMLEQSATPLDDTDRRYLATIVGAAKRMGQLIDDLLSFSRVGRTALTPHRVDLNQLVLEAQREVTGEVTGANPSAVRWKVASLPAAEGDRALLRLVFVNLISNALKYSSTRDNPEIEIGTIPGDAREIVIFVRDNGVGFDMAYAHKLFGVFQRLHRQEDFPGTGIGLANVRRIVQRHGGRTWAEGIPNEGATFFVSLPAPSGNQRTANVD